MLKEITNLLKDSNSRMSKYSQFNDCVILNSRQTNDYSITQFNMQTGSP